MWSARCLFLTCVLASVGSVAEADVRRDAWSGLEVHPAVVNSVLYPGDGAKRLSLRGEWDFWKSKMDSPGCCVWAEMRKEPKKVAVPGTWDVSRVGDPGLSRNYRCDDHTDRPCRSAYNGNAILRKTFTIPADWAGKRIWLKAGLVSAKANVYLKCEPTFGHHDVGRIDTYCGTYKWDVTAFVEVGREGELLFVVDNTLGNRAGSHSHSGGIMRDVEFEATEDVYIDDAWVRGDFDKREAQVSVGLGGLEGLEGLGVRATVEGEEKEATLRSTPTPSTYTLEIPLRNFRPWSPESPNLYTAKVELVSADGKVLQTRFERFGVRKFEARGKEIFLNGKPFFFRGCGDNIIEPIHGAMPADAEHHRRHLRTMKALGFNYVRHHTRCPYPEYFEAADEVGIVVQPELPYYANYAEDDFPFDPLRDAEERWEHFRRYVSWGVASSGNEGRFTPALDRELYRWQKERMPERLIGAQDGGTYQMPGHGAGASDFCWGPLSVWPRGAFDERPFICHEFLNLSAKSDYRIAGDFTGLWCPPETPERRAAFMAKSRLSMRAGEALQDAQNALQAFWIRRGLEQARLDPYCDGYALWSICDSTAYDPTAGAYVGQGPLDPFWRTKRNGLSFADFSRFNGPVAALFDTEDGPDARCKLKFSWPREFAWGGTNRVFASGERLPMHFFLAQYGEEDLADVVYAWRLATPDRVLADGRYDLGTVAVGPRRKLGFREWTVPALERPVKAVLTATVMSRGEKVTENAWDFYLLPDYGRPAVPADTVVAAFGSEEAKRALADGRNLVEIANADTPANVTLGWWWIGKQCGVVVNRSPLLKYLPYERFLTPLWMRTMREGLKLPVAGFTEDDLVIYGEGSDACYLYLAARRLPNGRKHVLVAGLDVNAALPEVNALLKGVYEMGFK